MFACCVYLKGVIINSIVATDIYSAKPDPNLLKGNEIKHALKNYVSNIIKY